MGSQNPAVQLQFKTEPSSSAGTGVALGSQPVVQIEDQSGDVVGSADNAVTLAAYSDSDCTTAASGTFSVTTNGLAASSGIASFTGATYVGAVPSTIYIGASADGLTSACSSAVTIMAGTPTKLIFSTEPADPSAVAGTSLATQPAVTVEDAYGNVVTTSTNAVTLTAYTDSACTTAGTGTLGASTNPLTPTSGRATFADVNYTKSGTFYIGASATGLTSACSNSISVAAGPPAKLVWATQPGSAFVNACQSINVGVQDSYGNTATVTGSAITVTLSSTGSGVFYSDSGCTSSKSSFTIAVDQSNTGTIYLSDSVVETQASFATATDLTAIPDAMIYWQLEPIMSVSPTTFETGTCVPVTLTLEDANGNTGLSFPDNETANVNTGSEISWYTNSSCSSVSSFPLPVPAGQTTVTYYIEDLRADGATYAYFFNGSGNYIGIGNTEDFTVTANTATTLVVTGPTFVPPSTCAGPYTVTATDSYQNASNITGSALTVDLSVTSGSAQTYSDSGCTTSASSVQIGVSSSSQTFYVEDSATEISEITASATSFTSGTFDLDSVSTSPLEQVVVDDWEGDACVLISGGVKCWGINFWGQLGNGTTTNSLTPVAVSGLSTGVTQLAEIGGLACALKSDHTIWCWGYNEYVTGGSTPKEQKVSGNPLLATQIIGGGDYLGEMCAITAANALYCAGYTGAWSELIASGVTSVAIQDSGFCAILSGGDLQCWGDNKYSELGIGTTGGSYSTPQQVVGLTTGVSATAITGESSCALVSGSVECWGTAGDGVANSNSPAAVGAPLTSGVTSLIGGGGGGCNNDSALFAVTTSGALYGWGAIHNSCSLGNVGIFANGTNTTGYEYTSPHEIFSSGVQSMSSVFGSAACAIVYGNLECWGSNNFGQLGTDTLNDSYVAIYPQSLE